jgi:hypothetical protein
MKAILITLLSLGFSFNLFAQNKLSNMEKMEGYSLLFNGESLDGWVGNKTDYVAEDGMIVIYPDRGGKGNLFTERNMPISISNLNSS